MASNVYNLHINSPGLLPIMKTAVSTVIPVLVSSPSVQLILVPFTALFTGPMYRTEDSGVIRRPEDLLNVNMIESSTVV